MLGLQERRALQQSREQSDVDVQMGRGWMRRDEVVGGDARVQLSHTRADLGRLRTRTRRRCAE